MNEWMSNLRSREYSEIGLYSRTQKRMLQERSKRSITGSLVSSSLGRPCLDTA